MSQLNSDFRQVCEKNMEKGSITWRSPSNIALVKYWGKYDLQLPMNPSISFTLDQCHTTTELKYEKRVGDLRGHEFKVFLEGVESTSFRPKIEQFFQRIESMCPVVSKFRFEIHTSNSFPHSSGIASSASGMSALAACVVSLQKSIDPSMIGEDQEEQLISMLARLGSGSACRSLTGPLVVWGEHPDIEGSSNNFGTLYPYEVHPVFTSFRDSILLVDKGEKQVSSTLGHNLMNNHPFALQRFEQARKNLSLLIPVLKNGDLSEFIRIVESEALSLHAMMMTSNPYFILMKPNTLEILNRVWQYRQNNSSHLCFTLDAGANVHLLYPEKEAVDVERFIENELVAFCQNNQYICDKVGVGARSM